MKKISMVLILIFGLASALSFMNGTFVLGKSEAEITSAIQSESSATPEVKDAALNTNVESKVYINSTYDNSETVTSDDVNTQSASASTNSNSVQTSYESQINDSKTAVQANSDIIKDIVLVNRSNKLDKNFVPKTLTTPKIKFVASSDSSVRKMTPEAAKALEKLFYAAKADGVTLLGVSAYRAYSYQDNLYNKKVAADGQYEADKYVAQPGTSEHQTGLAIDILSNEYSNLDEGFAKTKAFAWLEKNCFKYGYIVRYPKGKEYITGYNYEPWHLRYIGTTAATEISEKQITLEEYFNGEVIQAANY